MVTTVIKTFLFQAFSSFFLPIVTNKQKNVRRSIPVFMKMWSSLLWLVKGCLRDSKKNFEDVLSGIDSILALDLKPAHKCIWFGQYTPYTTFNQPFIGSWTLQSAKDFGSVIDHALLSSIPNLIQCESSLATLPFAFVRACWHWFCWKVLKHSYCMFHDWTSVPVTLYSC